MALIADFNPRSHEGSDRVRVLLLCHLLQNFNPRSHEGSDFYTGYNDRRYLISTRAPTRGATLFHSVKGRTENNFNPRSHEGSDTHILP